MNDPVYISRNFTEFGPFTTVEVVDFQKRGILVESDFVRTHGTETWSPLSDWLTTAATEAPAAPAAPEAAPAEAKPKAPAKKRSAKASGKKAAA